MRPIDSSLPLGEQLAAAWSNAQLFDQAAFMVWFRGRSEAVQGWAHRCPPSRIYRLCRPSGELPVCAVVVGYAETGVVVQLLGPGERGVIHPDGLEPLPDAAIHELIKEYSLLEISGGTGG